MIIKDPAITLGAVDFSDHTIAAALDAPQSAADDRTFGNPYASDAVSGAQSVTLSLRWDDTLAALLETASGSELALVITPKTGGGTIDAQVIFDQPPMPKIGIGEKAEVDLVLAVVDVIDWTAAA